MKKIIIAFVFSLITQFLLAQNYNMTNGTITTCGGTFYDSGGSSGNYSSNENYTLTFCPSVPNAKMTINFTSFIVETDYDFLLIYDGANTAAPLIGKFDNGFPLSGIIMASSTNTSGCLTFVFDSDNSGNYSGWKGTMSCTLPCQSVVSTIAGSTPALSGGYIDICPGQTVSFSGAASFPENGLYYTQSDATSTFVWEFGDGTSATGQNVTHTYANPGGYDVNLNITDQNNCVNINDVNAIVRVSTTPTFAGTNISSSTICLGQSATLTGSPNMTIWSQPFGGLVAGTTFLPDGSGAEYTTQICVQGFGMWQTVTAATDVVSICMDLEHSYLGDLEVYIECPNGDSMLLFNGYDGSGSDEFLGEPIDVDANTNPGVPYTYCFIPGATTTFEDIVNGTTPTYSYVDLAGISHTNQEYIPGGSYAPESSSGFNALAGCPLNGCWRIHVIDHIYSDNGYIFEWSLNFNPSLIPAPITFTPALVSQQWSGTTNSGLTTTTSNSVTVTPTALGTYNYTYSILDDFGCTHDTTISLTVTNGPDIPITASLASVCTGISSTLSAPDLSTFQWSTGETTPSITVSPTATTTYSVSGVNASGCVCSSTVTVGFEDIYATITPATDNICFGESTTLNATSTGGGINYNWSTGDGTAVILVNPTNITTYSVTCTDSIGCTSSATAVVNVHPLPVLEFSADPRSGCAPTTINFSNQSSGDISFYSWDFGDGKVSAEPNPVHTYSSGVFTVTLQATTVENCQSSLTKNDFITVLANPVASFSPNPLVTSEGEPITFINLSLGASEYLWNFGDGTASSIVQSPIHLYPASGEYLVSLVAKNTAGCIDSTNSVIYIKPLFTFYVPNSFSPNTDGLNDVFRPYGTGWYTDDYSMRIYNRWGQLLFSTTDINNGWDGMMPDGDEAATGVYFVKFLIKSNDGLFHEYYKSLVLIK